MSPQQTWQLFNKLETIDSEATTCWNRTISSQSQEYTQHLGWGLYLTIMMYQGKKYFDIQRWRMPPGQHESKPTMTVIRLAENDMDKLRCFKPTCIKKYLSLKMLNLVTVIIAKRNIYFVADVIFFCGVY